VLLSLRFRTDKIATGRGVLRLSSAISVGVWTPNEQKLKTAFISTPVEVGVFC